MTSKREMANFCRDAGEYMSARQALKDRELKSVYERARAVADKLRGAAAGDEESDFARADQPQAPVSGERPAAWPEPTEEHPSEEQLEEWVLDSICDATDGCTVEPDGVCPHGHPSWLLRLGLI